MKECVETLSSLRKEYEQVEEEYNKMKSEEVDIKNYLEKCDSHVKENDAKIRHWKNQVIDWYKIDRTFCCYNFYFIVYIFA